MCILVHPVPPTIAETRVATTLFNTSLQARVAAEPSLAWLDLLPHLCDGATGEVHPHLIELEGTHLKPHYVELLERALPREAGAGGGST